MRGRVLGSGKYDGQCSPDSSNVASGPQHWGGYCKGGIAPLIHYLEKLHNTTTDPVLSLNAGNSYFGTLWWRKFRGMRISSFFNKGVFADEAVTYSSITAKDVFDVHSVSLAEFYEGPGTISNVLKNVEAPVVLSNFDFSAEPTFANCKKTASPNTPCIEDEYVITQKGGRKIGVIGLIATDLNNIASPGDNIVPKEGGDFVATTQAIISKIQKAHTDCNIIVVLSNLEADQNKELARKVIGIDIIIGTRAMGQNLDALGTNPLVLTNLVNEKVILTGSLQYQKSIQELKLTFDANGLIVSWSHKDVTLYAKCTDYDGWTGSAGGTSYTCGQLAEFYECGGPANQTLGGTSLKDIQATNGDDATLACCACGKYGGNGGFDSYTWAQVNDQYNQIKLFENEKIGEGNHRFYGERGDPSGGCHGGNDQNPVEGVVTCDTAQVTNAMMVACTDCHAAFQNGGGIRDSIGSTGGTFPITLGDILQAYPYQNTVSTVNVLGTTLVRFLDLSVEGYNPSSGHGKFFQMAGIRMAWNPATQKAIRIDICRGWSRVTSSCTGGWVPLIGKALQETYKIAVNNFIMGGGDGYSILQSEGSNVNEFGERLDTAVMDFVKNQLPAMDTSFYDTMNSTCNGFQQNFEQTFNQTKCRIVKASDESPFKCPRTHIQKCYDVEGNKSSWSIENIMRPNTTDNYDYQCAQCTGFGQCDELNGFVCRCKKSLIKGLDWPRQYVLTTSRCETGGGLGLQLSYGPDCGSLKTLQESGSIVVGIITGLLISMASIGFSVWLFQNHHHKIVKASQPKFQHLVNIGCVLIGLSCIVSALAPSRITCNASVMFEGTGFMMILAPYIFKMSIVARIFNNKSLQRLKGNAMQKYLSLFGLIAIEIGMILILIGIAPQDRTVLLLDEDISPNSYTFVCRPQSEEGIPQGTIWIVSALALNIITLICGVYMAFQVRNVASVYGEAKYIGFVMYNLFIFGGIAVLLGLVSGKNPYLQHTLVSIMKVICCFGVIFMMWTPKWLLTKQHGPNVAPMTIGSHTTQGTYDEHPHDVYDEIRSVLSRIKHVDGEKIKNGTKEETAKLRKAAKELHEKLS
eukprot:g3401.t1